MHSDIRQEIDLLMSQMELAVVGQAHIVKGLTIALLTNGNVLLEGLPGTAETRSIKMLSKTLRAGLARLQFTPDLLPSDVTGTEIYQEVEGKLVLSFLQGLIFNNCINPNNGRDNIFMNRFFGVCFRK